MHDEALRAQILATMQHFDRKQRRRYWRWWEHQTTDKQVIEHAGKRYPVRHILETATGNRNAPLTTLLAHLARAGLTTVAVVRSRGRRKARFRPQLPKGRIRQQPEREFENRVIIPLLKRWGLPYEKGYPCKLDAQRSGIIDFLVFTEDGGQELTLFENKSGLRTNNQLSKASAQASRYADSLELRSFVLAAPEGLWIYRYSEGKAQLEHRFTPAEIEAGAFEARALLFRLRQP
ncbi:MAG: hypothetical protein OHK0022_54850 [Roseiflexaceae bacterium]